MSTPSGLRADFWKFWTGQTVSRLGTAFTQFALPLLIYKLTGSALNLALTTASEMLPYLFFGLVIGAWVDRANRKRLMISVSLLQGAVIAAIPLLYGVGLLTVWWVYAAGFIGSTLNIFFESAEFAAIPSLVGRDDIVTANGRIQASYAAMSVIGPPLAGALVTLMPIETVFLFDAASFIASALSLALVAVSFNSADDAKKEPTSILHDVVEGLRYVIAHPVLRNISLMMAMVNFVNTTTGAQLVLFAKRELNAGDDQVSYLYAAGGLGVVVLALLAGPLRKRFSFSTVALGALMASGLLIVAFSFTRSIWLALPIWGVAAGLGILFNINTGSLRQAIVPPHLLGRIMSIAGVLAWSAIPLGALAGGVAIDQTGDVALVYAIIGVLTFLIPLGFTFSPLGALHTIRIRFHPSI